MSFSLQMITSHTIPAPIPPHGNHGHYPHFNPVNLASLSNGGGLVVTSTSPIAPTGLTVLAENLAIEGILNVGGELPLQGTVALEGSVPVGGQAETQYSCGNGNVGIINEAGAPNGVIGGIGHNFAGINGHGPAGGPGLGPYASGLNNINPGFGRNHELAKQF